MPAPSPRLHAFVGGQALSAFRLSALLERLRLHEPGVADLQARHVYWVEAQDSGSLADSEVVRISALLDAQPAGGAGQPGGGSERAGEPSTGHLVVVMPRPGTVSPWSSKATDIARNCALPVRRVERVTEYRLQARPGWFGGVKALGAESVATLVALLHDRMTEAVTFEREGARALFAHREGPAMARIDVSGRGRAALEDANARQGLALSGEEIDYLA
jgi:phosphoribosylformylglycinamidine synthase